MWFSRGGTLLGSVDGMDTVNWRFDLNSLREVSFLRCLDSAVIATLDRSGRVVSVLLVV